MKAMTVVIVFDNYHSLISTLVNLCSSVAMNKTCLSLPDKGEFASLNQGILIKNS